MGTYNRVLIKELHLILETKVDEDRLEYHENLLEELFANENYVNLEIKDFDLLTRSKLVNNQVKLNSAIDEPYIDDVLFLLQLKQRGFEFEIKSEYDPFWDTFDTSNYKFI